MKIDTLGAREFARLTKQAGVPKIRIHDLRHTSASLLLLAGVSPKLVQERLGHTTLAMTMDVYAHVLPSQQEDAAAKMGALLYG